MRLLKYQANSNSVGKRIVELVVANYLDVFVAVKEHQVITRDFYEHQFSVIGADTLAGCCSVINAQLGRLWLTL